MDELQGIKARRTRRSRLITAMLPMTLNAYLH